MKNNHRFFYKYLITPQSFIVLAIILCYFACHVTSLFFIFILFRSIRTNYVTILLTICFFIIIGVFRIFFENCYEYALLLLQNNLRQEMISPFYSKYINQQGKISTKVKQISITRLTANLEFFVRYFFSLRYDFLLIAISFLFLLILNYFFPLFYLILVAALILLSNGAADYVLRQLLARHLWSIFKTRKKIIKLQPYLLAPLTKNHNRKFQVNPAFVRHHSHVIKIQNKIRMTEEVIKSLDQLTSLFLLFAIIIYFYFYVSVHKDFFYSLLVTSIFWQNFTMMLFTKLKHNISIYPRYNAIRKEII